MDENQLKRILRAKVSQAIGGDDSTMSDKRVDAIQYYLGNTMGNEVEGRSQVISTDVSDTIEQAMPALMRIFESGKSVEFSPVASDQIESAKLATEYCNYVYSRDNNGFLNTQTFIKDGLLNATGCMKAYWDEQDEYETYTLDGVTDEQLTLALDADDSLELVDQEEVPMPEPTNEAEAMQLSMMPQLFNVTLKKKTTVGRVQIEPVPPEEVLLDQDGRYVDLKLTGCSWVGHKSAITISELRERGVDEDILAGLTEFDETEHQEEVERRENDGGATGEDAELDDPSREVVMYEIYAHIDDDEDGITELRRIIAVGEDMQHIIENEEVDFQPLCVYSPILMPHRISGRSLAELVFELQEIKTAMYRHYMDNIFGALNQSTAINEDAVNLDDMLISNPNRIIRVDPEFGSPRDSIMPLTAPWMGNELLQGMQYMDEIRQNRTGISDAAAGVDANTLANANTGVYAKYMERAQATIDLIARNIAEIGLKPLFKLILYITKHYQTESREIEIKGQWQQVEPQQWATNMGVTVKVGLGTGNKDLELSYLEKVLVAQEKALALGLCTRENIHAALVDSVELSGLPAEKYFTLQPPQPPQASPKDPATIMAEAELDKNQIRAEQDHEEMMHKSIIKLQEIALEHGIGLEQLPAFHILSEQEVRTHTERAMQKQQEMAQEQQMQQGAMPPMQPPVEGM